MENKDSLSTYFPDSEYKQVLQSTALFAEPKKGSKTLGPVLVSLILLDNTNLSTLKYFSMIDRFFLYNPNMGTSNSLEEGSLESLLFSLFLDLELHSYCSLRYVKELVQVFRYHPLVKKSGLPPIVNEWQAFSNGLYNLQTDEFRGFSPSIFTLSNLGFPFIRDSSCPLFLKFLDEFCEGHEDRKNFIRAMFKLLILGRTEYQVFFYIEGPGGSGKSTLTNILSALVGSNASITTSLKSLNSDIFEPVNIANKKLILISDTEAYKRDISFLKQLVGGDSLKGHRKYVQGNFDIRESGIVVIVGNYPLLIRDSGHALTRRLRVFRASKQPTEKKILFTVNGVATLLALRCPDNSFDSFDGLLTSELPGIYQWALSFPSELLSVYIENTYESVPSLRELMDENTDYINPLDGWIRTTLERGSDGCYLGFKLKMSSQHDLCMAYHKRLLYPLFQFYCEKIGVPPYNQRRFSADILDALKSVLKTRSVQKIGRQEGIFVTGIQIRRDFLTHSVLSGSLSDNPFHPRRGHSGHLGASRVATPYDKFGNRY